MALKGQDALRRKLLKMTPEIRAQLEIAVLAGAQDVAKTAKALVPKRSGRLMDSIGAVLGDAPSTTATQALRGGGSKADGIRATAYAGDDNAYYAGWIEFGTAPHKQGGLYKGTLHPGTVAQPFFFPAFRTNKKRAKSRVTRAIKKAIKKAAQS
ncbi:HK97-gp10 family putative phage morphogenesis protein [Azorhizobium sp. AG788]|uniref:HK97-gp10 family putative phage morphogenesis protein n=1 Tax=Azorhizobium sp. AG788 TaxID=2183897 RepID=UPI003139EA73